MDQKNKEVLETIIQKKYRNITGVIAYKEGEKLYEKYFNECDINSTIHIYSVTKSILSMLVGIAIDKGYIKSIEQKVLDFFPEYKVMKNETVIQKITLKDLLTMSAPYKYGNIRVPYIKYFTNEDWVNFSLDLLGGKDTIGEFKYAPLIGPDIISGIIMKTTGKTVLEFAREYLFSPLGIEVKKKLMFKNKEEQMEFNKAIDISGWVCDPKGVNTAGWGLTLSTMDMAKLGQLYLNDGLWEGMQIVSKSWIEDSTSEHNRWKKENLAYGYLWWLHDSGYAAMGDGGNVIYVNTKKKIVVSITALFKPRVFDRLRFIKEVIEPML